MMSAVVFGGLVLSLPERVFRAVGPVHRGAAAVHGVGDACGGRVPGDKDRRAFRHQPHRRCVLHSGVFFPKPQH